MKKNADSIYTKYISEALSKDYTHAMTRFDSIVKDFRACKKIDGTSLSLLSELLTYVSKFVEEHAIDQNITGLKGAKDKIRAAADALDNAAEKLRKGDAANGEMGIKDMEPAGDTLGGDTEGGDLEGGSDADFGSDDADMPTDGEDSDMPTDGEDKGSDEFGSETDDMPSGSLDSEPAAPKKPSKLASKLTGGDTGGFPG